MKLTASNSMLDHSNSRLTASGRYARSRPVASVASLNTARNRRSWGLETSLAIPSSYGPSSPALQSVSQLAEAAWRYPVGEVGLRPAERDRVRAAALLTEARLEFGHPRLGHAPGSSLPVSRGGFLAETGFQFLSGAEGGARCRIVKAKLPRLQAQLQSQYRTAQHQPARSAFRCRQRLILASAQLAALQRRLQVVSPRVVLPSFP